ncbi:MAG: type I-U CRISPR-associated protein Cas5/Cas6 [Planctomycetes bacterium]|nr:type I-U CRISPR-associated protein Cas5/Cas6 [Planctomycetota bacterium]
MPSHLCLSIRFLLSEFHGRREQHSPEWPPSPLRLFQSLVASAAARSRGRQFPPSLRQALHWLEEQAPPEVVAPAARAAAGFCLSVPNNSMDVVAAAWSRGNVSDSDPATHRTMKPVRPTRLLEDGEVHYLWLLQEGLSSAEGDPVECLRELARGVVALGWGVDLVVAHGRVLSEDDACALPGERWLPIVAPAEAGLRVPVKGTLEDLGRRHAGFLERVRDDVFRSPPPLTAYRLVEYRRATDPAPRAVGAFSLLKLDASGFRAFHTPRRALTVAGMVRHATKQAATASGRPHDWINRFVLGHSNSSGGEGREVRHVPVGPRRFAFLPVPSIEGRGQSKPRVVGDVRRVFLSCYADDCAEELAWARRTLSGCELIDEASKQPVALLNLLPASDRMVTLYTSAAATWATVTPVVLPGFAGRRGRKVEELLRESILQAGFSQAMADCAELDWRGVGFWPGADLPSHYGVPRHIARFPRCHVRITWRDSAGAPIPVPGPICLGGGRFFGIGLFAPMDP